MRWCMIGLLIWWSCGETPGFSHKVLQFWQFETSSVREIIVQLCIQQQVQVKMCDAACVKQSFFSWVLWLCHIQCTLEVVPDSFFSLHTRGWSGGAKVLCIVHQWGVQLILAYSWARPAILVVGKGRGGMFLFLLFLHFRSCFSFFPVPLFHLLYSLFYLFSPFLWETTQNDPQGLTCR